MALTKPFIFSPYKNSNAPRFYFQTEKTRSKSNAGNSVFILQVYQSGGVVQQSCQFPGKKLKIISFFEIRLLGNMRLELLHKL